MSALLEEHPFENIISILAHGRPDLAVRASVQSLLDGPSKTSLGAGLTLRQGAGIARMGQGRRKVLDTLDGRGELVAAGLARQRHELVGVDGVARRELRARVGEVVRFVCFERCRGLVPSY